MKTSYFAKYRNNQNGVSIALKTVPGFKGEFYPDLFPKWNFLNKYKQDGDIDYFIESYYYEVLRPLYPNKVWEDLKDKTLLCWEKPGSFCHRRLVAKWLEGIFGVVIPEIK